MILKKPNLKHTLDKELEYAIFRDHPTNHIFEDMGGLLKVNMDSINYIQMYIDGDFLKQLGYKGVIFNNYSTGNILVNTKPIIDKDFCLINQGKNTVWLSGVNNKMLKGKVVLRNILIYAGNDVEFYFNRAGELQYEGSVLNILNNLLSNVVTLDLGDRGGIQCHLYINGSPDKIINNKTLLDLFKMHFGALGRLNFIDKQDGITYDFKNNQIMIQV